VPPNRNHSYRCTVSRLLKAGEEDVATDRSARQRETRLTEVLIGQLLGPAENRGPATLTTCDGLLREDRRRFRVLAEHAELVGRPAPGVLGGTKHGAETLCDSSTNPKGPPTPYGRR